MSLQFKPMPWLSAITAICLAILISLGVWQYQRLHWKKALLAEVEAAVTAPPLSSLAELEASIEAGKPVDFRRIGFSAMVDGNGSYLVYSSRSDGIYWRQFSPMQDGAHSFFGAFGYIKDKDRGGVTDTLAQPPISPSPIAGYIRKNHKMGAIEALVKNKANPESNRYFKFNQTGDWAQGSAASYYIDIDAQIADARQLPIKRPEIANNHLDYMLTWFSFAGILLFIYGLIHVRSGRLKFHESK